MTLDVAEEAEDAAIRLSAPLSGTPGYKNMLLLLVASEVTELEN